MDVGRLINLAKQRLEHGQTEGAIDALREALAIDPEQAEAHALMALALLQSKRLHAAMLEAAAALQQEAELELGNYVMAHICIAKRQFSSAQTHINQLLALDSGDADYYLLQAELYELTRERNKILPQLEMALQLQPESPAVLAELSRYYTGQGELKKGHHYAESALWHDPENNSALVAMGSVLLRMGKTRDAREHALWALRQSPESSAALGLMAEVKAKSSLLLGLWWRYNTWMNQAGEGRSIIILLLAYLTYRILSMAMGDMERPDIASMINYTWLAIVLYTFIGPEIFMRSLRKEIADVKLREDF